MSNLTTEAQRSQRGSPGGAVTRAQQQDDQLTRAIIGAAIDVHRALGPGLLESTYETCFSKELRLRELRHDRQIALPVEYKGETLECGNRLDLVVEDQVVVELKCVEKILPIHEAQLLTYLRLSGIRTGLLINFNVSVLRDGIIRRVL